jgi:hypothetical protein
MVDKPQTLHRSKVGGVSGHLGQSTLLTGNGALAVVFGLGEAPASPKLSPIRVRSLPERRPIGGLADRGRGRADGCVVKT